MPLESKIYTALTGSTLITAITTRIYPMIAPPEVTTPYIIYFRVSGGQINTLNGYATCENPMIQIDAFSTGYSQAKTLTVNMHTVLNATTTFKAILVSDNDLYEEEAALYRVSSDYSIINKE